ALFLVKWLVLAYVLEALLITYVPASMIAGLVGGEGIVPIAIAALVGMPAYLNGYVAPPLLAGLMEQGMSAGAAMAFMMAGAVSCISAMVAVWSLVNRAVFASYIGLGLAGAILSGLIFQAIM
ncbi:MAG TPA: permease, partial [Hyphomicrobiales bacterium]|nr:permease [Hyphomicrobiales bacterium]